jgi:hypothetical protein
MVKINTVIHPAPPNPVNFNVVPQPDSTNGIETAGAPQAHFYPKRDKDNNRTTAEAYTLAQNYPNPFSGSTEIAYTLPRETSVRITVHDVLGREVAVLAIGVIQPGQHTAQFDGKGLPEHTAQFDGKGLPGGLYILRFESTEYTAMRVMHVRR